MKLPLCELCDRGATKSAIIKDYYYKHLCIVHFNELATDEVSSGHAEYERGRNHEDHLQDIMQPYNGDGTPNVDFARLYSTQAQKLFGEDGLREAERA